MKRSIPLFIMIICRIALAAQTYQYHPLVDSATNKEWNYGCFFYTGMSSGYSPQQPRVSMISDTLINGFKYRKIITSGENYSYGYPYFGGVYEDSTRKVFCKSASDSSAFIGDVIFDFSLQLNDTFILTQNYNTVIKVQSIDTIFIGGALRRKFVFFPVSNYDTTHVIWIEGIGSLQYGVIMADFDCLLWTDHLCNESENDSLIYVSPVNYCFFTGINQINNEDLSFHAYPNPVSDICSLDFTNNREILRLSVLDMTGREISSFFIDKAIPTFSFNTRFLASGIYLLKVSSPVGKSSVIKMIKE